VAQARGSFNEQGTTIVDKYGQTKLHPAALLERDSRVSYARLMRSTATGLPSRRKIRLLLQAVIA
jgi:hypothetical protein